jgi:hypothetical protein
LLTLAIGIFSHAFLEASEKVCQIQYNSGIALVGGDSKIHFAVRRVNEGASMGITVAAQCSQSAPRS